MLQTWVADDVDHRLDAGTFVKISELGKQVCRTKTWMSRWSTKTAPYHAVSYRGCGGRR